MPQEPERKEKTKGEGYRDPNLLVEQSPTDTNVEAPAYVAIRDVLAAEIRSGARPPENRLPSERDLAEQHGVARMTARKALALLEAEGKIYRAERRGYFVAADRIRYDPSSPINLMRQLRNQGHLTENVYLGRSLLEANERLAYYFDAEAGTRLALERCIVVVDGQPAVYTEDFLLLDALPGYEDRPFVSPMTQNLQRNYGVYPKSSWFRIRSAPLSLVAAQHLGVSPDSPGINISFVQNHGGRPVMTSRCFWRSDVVDLVFSTPERAAPG